MISAFSPDPSQNKAKHAGSLNTVFRPMKTHWVPTRPLPRSHTPLPRCGPDGLIQNEVGKNLGFPLAECKEQDHQEHAC